MARIHFLNVGCADTTIIKTNKDNTILVDCCDQIKDYTNYLPKNKCIKAVFITHQHYDHFLGLDYLKDNNYSIEYLIYSPYIRRYGDNSVEYEEWEKFNELADYFKEHSSKIYKPYRQIKFKEPWWEIDDLKIWILGPEKSIATSDTRELHDASLVFTMMGKTGKCCFTGDASDSNLNFVARNTNNFCEYILHASHHGSINGADLDFIKQADPKYTIISTESGIHSNVPHPTALQRYRKYSEKVYRTDVDDSKIIEI